MSKVTLGAREAGWRIAAILLDGDRCWRFVCMLRNYDVPDPVATCEVALALASRLRHDIREKLRGEILDGVLSGIDGFIEKTFTSQDADVFRDFYTDYFDECDDDDPISKNLSDVYIDRIAFYAEYDWYPDQLAALLGQTLGVGGFPTEASFIFTETTTDLHALLKRVEIKPERVRPEPGFGQGRSTADVGTPKGAPNIAEKVRDLPSVRQVVDECYNIAMMHNPTVTFFAGLIRSCIGSKELSMYDEDFKWVVSASAEFDQLPKLIEHVRLGLLRRMMFS